MKHVLFIAGWILVCCISTRDAVAQAPSVSTANNPKWYFIKVSDATNRVVTETEGKVCGRPQETNLNNMSNQLWRFEITTKGYIVINKASGKKLSVGWDGTDRIAVTSDDPTTVWALTPSSGVYYISMATEPAEGVAGNKYLYQQAAARDYEFTFAATVSRTPFTFPSIEIPFVSTDNNTVWLFVRSAATEKYLTDISNTPAGQVSFSLTDKKTSGNEIQQWKLIEKTPGGRVDFINRATGHAVNTSTLFDRYYFPQSAGDPETSQGWIIGPFGTKQNQYEIYTTVNGVTSYWNATTAGTTPDEYEGAATSTTYAWAFSWAEEQVTSVLPVYKNSNVFAYAENGRIVVKGTDTYTITSLLGAQVDRNATLPAGIYLVTAPGTTMKVLVK